MKSFDGLRDRLRKPGMSPTPAMMTLAAGSVVACQTIRRRFALRVTLETVAHIQIDCANRGGLLTHISMTSRARNLRADMRRMIKSQMSGGAVIVNPHPGDILAASLISSHLFNLRLVRGDHLMARHAKRYVGDCGIRAGIDSGVTIFALQSISEVYFVGKSDGLYRLSAPAQKIIDRGAEGGVSGSKDAGTDGNVWRGGMSGHAGLRCNNQCQCANACKRDETPNYPAPGSPHVRGRRSLTTNAPQNCRCYTTLPNIVNIQDCR